MAVLMAVVHNVFNFNSDRFAIEYTFYFANAIFKFIWTLALSVGNLNEAVRQN